MDEYKNLTKNQVNALLWLDTAEYVLGHSLDGDERLDGYSCDGAYAAYRAGLSIGEYVDRVNAFADALVLASNEAERRAGAYCL